MKTITVNAIGDPCPIPVIKATKAFNEMQEAGILEVHVGRGTKLESACEQQGGKGCE